MTLAPITHPDLDGVRHGFFTRQGGASSGIYATLNCGRGSADQSEIVAINRGRVAAHMGVDPDWLVGAYQVHSADVVHVTGPLPDPPRADGLVTATRGVALSVLTADCQPVLFADREAGVIGATHAGWKGALSGVLTRTVEAMEALGARPGRIAAVIGPTISQRAYEVGPEFMEDFLAEDPDRARYFAQGEGDRYQFDLPRYGLDRLRDAGIIDPAWTRHCTYADADRFFSYRRATHAQNADYGRQISAIVLD
ncbi:peptidoglycan editing factor PgeF [Salipiger sp. IMCC34102]|uniref:peptidoglycan editing factor PgeF n=1 Tax=Salipiger sp. IMCC34102 TaxID=2510647 RepID=UPI00101B76E9|nr:peptidoglycan editing factor PgeF [Salipiger sp. IMCC34102]RYH01432.1 peptidoglycan editing factor PgeF [Salipiger sp. IMCC34102]